MHALTVKTLKEIINNIPDDIPVSIERIDDRYFASGGWTSEKVAWGERTKISEADAFNLKGDERLRIEEHEGILYMIDLVESIDAFSAYVTTNDKGEKRLLIHANF